MEAFDANPDVATIAKTPAARRSDRSFCRRAAHRREAEAGAPEAGGRGRGRDRTGRCGAGGSGPHRRGRVPCSQGQKRHLTPLIIAIRHLTSLVAGKEARGCTIGRVTIPRGTVAASPHDLLDRHVRDGLWPDKPRPVKRPPSGPALLRLFDAMAGSRLLDIEARRMRERGEGLLHDRFGGARVQCLRRRGAAPDRPGAAALPLGRLLPGPSLQAGRSLDDGLRAVLLGLAAAVADPASGGRHKVFGDASLAVIPQTSTIASHLPRAVGVAFAIGRAKRLGLPTTWAPDSIAVCSFGDASLNHSTAVGALNTAGYCVAQGLPLPLLFVCEDNGLGISVPTPAGWVRQAAQRPGIRYFAADGDDPDGCARRHATRPTPRAWTAARRCCTCAPCATSPTPAPTSSPATAPPPRSPPTSTATRCWPWRRRSAAPTSPLGTRRSRSASRSWRPRSPAPRSSPARRRS